MTSYGLVFLAFLLFPRSSDLSYLRAMSSLTDIFLTILYLDTCFYTDKLYRTPAGMHFLSGTRCVFIPYASSPRGRTLDEVRTKVHTTILTVRRYAIHKTLANNFNGPGCRWSNVPMVPGLVFRQWFVQYSFVD